jgi:anti-sigma B factor antagonist
MEIREERAGDALVLAPDGNLSTGEDCHALENRLSAALTAGNRFLVVDCARVGHLTSPALRALLLAARKLTRASGRLVLCGMTAKVQKAFSISGFDRDFSVVPDRETALQLVFEPPPAASGTKGGARKRVVPKGTSSFVATPPEGAVQGSSTPSVDGTAAAVAETPAVVGSQTPDPCLAVADRLVTALGAGAHLPTSALPFSSPERVVSLNALADALLHALDVRAA